MYNSIFEQSRFISFDGSFSFFGVLFHTLIILIFFFQIEITPGTPNLAVTGA